MNKLYKQGSKIIEKVCEKVGATNIAHGRKIAFYNTPIKVIVHFKFNQKKVRLEFKYGKKKRVKTEKVTLHHTVEDVVNILSDAISDKMGDINTDLNEVARRRKERDEAVEQFCEALGITKHSRIITAKKNNLINLNFKDITPERVKKIAKALENND